jgi:hypothetical protein
MPYRGLIVFTPPSHLRRLADQVMRAPVLLPRHHPVLAIDSGEKRHAPRGPLFGIDAPSAVDPRDQGLVRLATDHGGAMAALWQRGDSGANEQEGEGSPEEK